jgi:hypothetical protein
MTVTLALNPEIEQQDLAQAKAAGVTVEAYPMSVIEAAVSPAPGERATLSEFEAALDAFSERTEGLQVL